jgi:hypothetical protein
VKRYLLASLVAGLVYAALGCLFVHCLLPARMEYELWSAVAGGDDFGLHGRYAQHVDDIHLHDTYFVAGWGLIGVHVGLRVALGCVSMALFAFWKRNSRRFRAASIAGFTVCLFAFVALPLRMHFATGMSSLLVCYCIAWGLLETQWATHLGALAWGRTAVGAA